MQRFAYSLSAILAAALLACGTPPGGAGTDTEATGTSVTGTSETGTSVTGTSETATTGTDTDPGPEPTGTDTDTDTTGTTVSPEHEALCHMIHAAAGQHPGFDAPGAAGAPRWGIPDAPPANLRVRRSWSSLSDAEKKVVVDAFLALKRVTVDSGDPGSARADYNSLCDALGQQSYARNLYDYYVEAHANAWLSHMTPQEGMYSAAHMGSQFLPWHRYVLLRIEADMAEAVGNPEFALPYWDWTDCYTDGAPNGCAEMFQPDLLGTPGSCDDASSAVSGYLVDQGFLTNIYTDPGGPPPFVPAAIQCGQRPIGRKVGCLVPAPPDSAAIAGIFDRVVYDAAPYDGCYVEEDVSFRQYLEGYDNDSAELLCVFAGCAMHGQGHFFVGGDMQFSSANPNDPMFFLHHAQVDRLWAAWQEENLASGDAGRMVDHGNPEYPDDYRGPLFIWSDVAASELFDYRVLGYAYDALPSPG